MLQGFRFGILGFGVLGYRVLGLLLCPSVFQSEGTSDLGVLNGTDLCAEVSTQSTSKRRV